jgi:hypothetical protein
MSATERQRRRRAKQKQQRAKIVRKAAALLAGDRRRRLSRAAKPLADGWNLRNGDPRTALDNIASGTVALILTSTPAEQDLVWLAPWAARVLLPGGSLVCFVDQSQLPAACAALEQALHYWWLVQLPHAPEILGDPGIITRQQPGLWYVKHRRRGRTMLPDWLHGGQVWPLIEHLTEPGETIIDPFGDPVWGRTAVCMGRRWIGVAGG